MTGAESSAVRYIVRFDRTGGGFGCAEVITAVSCLGGDRPLRPPRSMLALSIHCASQPTTFSKSLLCRAFGRRGRRNERLGKAARRK
jgi:hypothetical protein